MEDFLEAETEKIAELVRSNRKLGRLTQSGLADLAGIGKTAVFDIEHGKTSVRLCSLLKVFRALNIELSLSGPLDRKGVRNAQA